MSSVHCCLNLFLFVLITMKTKQKTIAIITNYIKSTCLEFVKPRIHEIAFVFIFAWFSNWYIFTWCDQCINFRLNFLLKSMYQTLCANKFAFFSFLVFVFSYFPTIYLIIDSNETVSMFFRCCSMNVRVCILLMFSRHNLEMWFKFVYSPIKSFNIFSLKYATSGHNRSILNFHTDRSKFNAVSIVKTFMKPHKCFESINIV